MSPLEECCTDCPLPATTAAYNGWRKVGDRWVMATLGMCDWHAAEDERARAEAMAS